MKSSGQKAVILVVSIVFVITLVAGCGEQELLSTRKSRLIAVENRQLKKELEDQKKLLGKCLQEKKDSEEQIHKSIKDLADNAFKDFEENVRLREENKKLEARVKEVERERDKLKAQVGQLKKEVEKLKKQAGSKPL